jgi:hypothetical protein
MDALDGLAALEQVVETIGEQLDDLYQRRDIPQAERVTLHSLEWTLAKLNGDLHTMETEVRDLRLAEARALDDLDRANAEREAAKMQRDELRAKAERKPWMEWHSRKVDKLHKRLPGNGILVHKLLVGDDLPELYEAGFRYLPITPEAELAKKAGELPAESYQWQVGDVVEHDDGSMSCTRPVTNRSEGWVFLLGDDSGLPQPEWERRGWKLFRKASDLGVQQLTPRQVEIGDSTGTDGEEPDE